MEAVERLTLLLLPPPVGNGDDTGQKIKAFLEGAGIPFDDAKGHKFVFDGFQMIVTHDRRSLDLIERILAKMTAKQVYRSK